VPAVSADQATGVKVPTSLGTDQEVHVRIAIVPSGTKFPVTVQTRLGNDINKDGDKFSVRTSEDVTIDGVVVIPSGTSVEGKIYLPEKPLSLNETKPMALCFQSISTEENSQLPIFANLVAHGGMVHTRRGLVDVPIKTSQLLLPSISGRPSVPDSHWPQVINTPAMSADNQTIRALFLFPGKGKTITFEPRDEVKVELEEDLKVSVRTK